MNILICYMHESELRLQSYEAMNKGTWARKNRGLRRNLPRADLGFDPAREPRRTPVNTVALASSTERWEARTNLEPRAPDLDLRSRLG